jgi:hypothetical protein
LESAGIENYSIAGDTRFDRVAAIAQNAPEISSHRFLKTVISCWLQAAHGNPMKNCLPVLLTIATI